MIITCPRCATRYFLGAGDVRPPGRHVRCARCQHTWFQEPSADLPTPIPVPVEEPEQVGPITDRGRMLGPPPDPAYPPQTAGRSGLLDSQSGLAFEPLAGPPDQVIPRGPLPAREQGSARSRGMVWLVAGVSFLSLLLVLFFSMPRQIAMVLPNTLGLYNALGIEVNISGFSLAASHKIQYANSIPIIVITGELLNETDAELEAPSIRIAVLDRGGKELHHWIVRPDQDQVGPRGKTSFSARLESPPAGSFDLSFRIARAEER